MELKDRIKTARVGAGLSQSELARRIGVAPQAIQAIEAGRVQQTKHILALSRELDVSPEYLAGETVNLNFRTPIVGIARAGTEDILYGITEENLGDTEPPEMATDKTVALEVRGSSMGGRIEDGDLVFYEDRREPVTPDLYGKVCVVSCSDGRVLIKRIKAGSRPGFFHLLSYSADPEFDVAVDWAARVTSIRPR